MEENKHTLLQDGMKYGLYLGLFWVFRYAFYLFGSQSIIFNSVYLLLTPFTLVIAYYLTKKFRDEQGGRISFLRAWGFGILLYFFGALIVSIPHYIYYEYIATSNYIADALESAKGMMQQLNSSPEMMEALENIQAPSSIGMALYDIIGNIFYGIIFSLPVAAVVSMSSNTDISSDN